MPWFSSSSSSKAKGAAAAGETAAAKAAAEKQKKAAVKAIALDIFDESHGEAAAEEEEEEAKTEPTPQRPSSTERVGGGENSGNTTEPASPATSAKGAPAASPAKKMIDADLAQGAPSGLYTEDETDPVKRRKDREARYRKEIYEARADMESQREMWEKLVKDSEQQVVDLRHQLVSATDERDRLRTNGSTEKLRRDARTREMTEELIRQKMRAAEISAEIDMFNHHLQLVYKRRASREKTKKPKKSLFHTCVEDDAADTVDIASLGIDFDDDVK